MTWLGWLSVAMSGAAIVVGILAMVVAVAAMRRS